MHATQFHARRSKLLPAVPANRKPVSARRSGDGMLADESFNARPSLAASYAEATLMCAVLEDAVDCFQKQFSRASQRAKYLGRQAERWLFSNDVTWPFSFLSICGVLDLCPEYIRQGLKGWRALRRETSENKSADTPTADAANGGLRQDDNIERATRDNCVIAATSLGDLPNR